MRTPAVHPTITIACAMLLAACADRAPTKPIANTGLEPSFSVSAPTVISLGRVHGQAVNGGGTIVGANGADIYVWSQSSGAQFVASGVVWDISEDGNFIGGRNVDERPVLWERDGLSWREITLPQFDFGGAVRAIASDPTTGAPLVMTGNARKVGYIRNPAVWERCTEGQSDCVSGWHLRVLDSPNDATWGQDVNVSGEVVGMDGTGCCLAVFWEVNGAMQLLPPLKAGESAAAWSLNDAGTVVVGRSGNRPVAWVRASRTSPFGAPTALPSKTSGCGASGAVAYAVMPDLVTSGTIVGQDCGAAAAWQVTVSGNSLTNMQRIALPSAVKSTKGSAQGINRSTSAKPGATGQAGGTGVFWRF